MAIARNENINKDITFMFKLFTKLCFHKRNITQVKARYVSSQDFSMKIEKAYTYMYRILSMTYQCVHSFEKRRKYKSPQ